jgi:hypothetical protein
MARHRRDYLDPSAGEDDETDALHEASTRDVRKRRFSDIQAASLQTYISSPEGSMVVGAQRRDVI